MSEHDFEPVRGLPGDLPPGERILWQGAPEWRALALRAFHLRSVALYFLALMIWRGAAALQQGASAAEAAQAALSLLAIAAPALGLLAGLALLSARTSVYTITNKRIVMRIGAALPKAFNLPFTIIENVALATNKDKTGDLALTLARPNKLAYLLLWPHARPIKLSRPQPTLRAIADAEGVAAILTEALKTALAERAAGAQGAAPEARHPASRAQRPALATA